MSTLIIVIFWLAVWHFLCEGILAPSARMILRNRLFALRDQVRHIHIERGGNRMAPDIALLHDGINRFLPRLKQITPLLLHDIDSAYRTDPEVRAIVQSHQQIIESAADPRIKEIVSQINGVLTKAVIANTAGWMVYLLPIGIVFVCFSRLTRLAAELFMTPSATVDVMTHNGLHA